jgi:hypothetical protein
MDPGVASVLQQDDQSQEGLFGQLDAQSIAAERAASHVSLELSEPENRRSWRIRLHGDSNRLESVAILARHPVHMLL